MQANQDLEKIIIGFLEHQDISVDISKELRSKYNGFKLYGNLIDYIINYNPKLVNFILEVSKLKRGNIPCQHIILYKDSNIKKITNPNTTEYPEYLPSIQQMFSADFMALVINFVKFGKIIRPNVSITDKNNAEIVRLLNFKLIHTEAQDQFIWQFLSKAIDIIGSEKLISTLEIEIKCNVYGSVTLIDLYELIYNTSLISGTKLPYINKEFFPTYENDLDLILKPFNAIILIKRITKGNYITF